MEEEEEEEEGDGLGFACASAVPDALHKVLSQYGSRVGEPEGYLLLALHAVMLQTGFVCVHAPGVGGSFELLVSGSDGKAEPLTLKYTLPQLLELSTAEEGASDRNVEEITLTCKKSGDAFCVCGTVAGGQGPEDCSLSLSTSRYVCDQSKAKESNPQLTIQNDANSIYSDAYGLWEEMMHRLSLPLLVLLCERAGLQEPSFLMLDTELQIKVLQHLPALSLAAVCCVCSELKFVGASDHLWKKRYEVEFGLKEGQNSCVSGWKTAFAAERSRRRSESEERLRDRSIKRDLMRLSASRNPMQPRGSLILRVFGLEHLRSSPPDLEIDTG